MEVVGGLALVVVVVVGVFITERVGSRMGTSFGCIIVGSGVLAGARCAMLLYYTE